MSFGFSVGDFLAVIQLVNKVRKDFVSAPDKFRQISNELGRLENTPRDIEVLLFERDLSQVQGERLKQITEDCRLILKDTQETLDKYSTLNSRGISTREKSTRLWNRLKWEPDDVRDLRGRITLIVASCTFFVVMLNGENVVKLLEGQEQQEEREQKREDQEQQRDRQVILNWFTPVDYSAQQSDFIRRRQAGTGQWLLNSTEYQHWLSAKGEALFCPGIPGAGKTMLSSIVVDNLLDLYRGDESIGICFIFLNFRQVAEQKLRDLIASLLKQLAHAKSALSQTVKYLYEKHKGRQTRPDFEELCDALHSVATEYSRVFMVIDALDECQVQDDNCRSRFIDELLNLWSNFDVNLLATSRFIPEITSRFGDGVKELEIRANDDDIVRYLDGNLSCLPRFVSHDSTLQTEIKEGIVQCVDGMFLLAQLHLDSLRGKRSPKAVRGTLKKLAKGSNAYDAAYHDAMDRIRGQLSDQKDLALQTLMWITFAKKPLSIIELRHALGVELNTTEFDEDNLPDLEDMVSYCCGLVNIDKDSDIIRLVHYTTQEYFSRTGETWFPDAQTQIAETCVTYLSFDVFESGVCESLLEFRTRLSSYPLYDYASRHWGNHAYLTPNYQFCYTFLTMASKVNACTQPYLSEEREFAPFSSEVPRGVTGLHVAAFFGLHEVVKRLVEVYAANTLDSFQMTPIKYAVKRQHFPVVELLLEKGAHVDSEIGDQTLLLYAANTRHDAIVTLLPGKGADIESMDDHGRTTLFYAAANGRELTVRLLLERGANINLRDDYRRTPLSYAIRSGNKLVVSLLLEKGADINSKDDYRTPGPLFFGANYGSRAARQFRIEHYIHQKDDYMRTPLSYAASKNHIKAPVQLLLKWGADIESNDNRGRTPLWWAFMRDRKDVAQLLLEKGAVKYWERH